MRKYFSLLIIFAFLLFLVACDKKDDFDDFEITDQAFNGNTYTFTIDTSETVESNDDLLEIAYTAAGQIYGELNDEIGLSKRVLKLMITVSGDEKLLITFIINDTINEPGLKLFETDFK